MIDSDKEKIEEYKKLIREKGSKKATDEVKKTGIFYNENFTDTHIVDPIFSSRFVQVANLHLSKLLSVEMLALDNMDENSYSPMNFQPFIKPLKIPTTTPKSNLMQCMFIEEESIISSADSFIVPPFLPVQTTQSR